MYIAYLVYGHEITIDITSVTNQQLHLHKFHIKTLKTIKITPTCFDLFLDHHQGETQLPDDDLKKIEKCRSDFNFFKVFLCGIYVSVIVG